MMTLLGSVIADDHRTHDESPGNTEWGVHRLGEDARLEGELAVVRRIDRRLQVVERATT